MNLTKVHFVCGGKREWDEVTRKILTIDELLDTYPYYVEVDGHHGVYPSLARYAAVATEGRLRGAKTIKSLEHNGRNWVDGRYKWPR